jgi:hypothetical protein
LLNNFCQIQQPLSPFARDARRFGQSIRSSKQKTRRSGFGQFVLAGV